MEKFKVGETVVCVINSRASLTIGKEYIIKSVWDDTEEDGVIQYRVTNDSDMDVYYDSIRFMPINEVRHFKIKEILK